MNKHITTIIAAAALFALRAQADTVTFQDGTLNPLTLTTYAGTEDTMLANNAGSLVTRNFGGRDNFEVGEEFSAGSLGNTRPREALLRFDVSSLSGQFASIDSVTLRLTVFANYSAASTSDVMQVFRIATANSDWVEGSANNSDQVGSACWDQKQYTVANWAGGAGPFDAGTDYLTPEIATQGFSSTTAAGDVLDFVFTDLSFFSDWVSGNNPGIGMRTVSMSDKELALYSSEATTVANRPQLIVTYSVPEPTSVTLLAVGMLGAFSQRRRPPCFNARNA